MQTLPEVLRNRTKAFAIRIVRLYRQLPNADEARVIGRQLLRCGTAVAANYRAVCRARSPAEFLAKIGVVVEVADETVFWLEFLVETRLVDAKRLQHEANEILAIVAASQRTARARGK